ncbi:RES family NAD+ phosphorylase [Halocola ammonii]
MRGFRLSRKKYARKLDGQDAARSNNRWNSKGTAVVYTAESRALAMAEVLFHLSLNHLSSTFQMVEIEIPDSVSVREISLKDPGRDWSENPPMPSSQKIGDDFIQCGDTCVLRVPSAVVPGDFNLLINPNHPEMKKIKVVEISDSPFDSRLLG